MNNMKILQINNFRKGFATNSSSTHSVIYTNSEDLYEDIGVFSKDYYGRFDNTLAVTKSAKIKYIAACIYNYPYMFSLMCSFYPEMKEYLDLAKQQIQKESEKTYNYEDNIFGMYCRGNIISEKTKDLKFDIEYLRHIIENPNIVIVGGSDEEDFVYTFVNTHKEVTSYIDRDTKIFNNGNYWVLYNRYGDRLRLCFEDDMPIPTYPELVDLKITDKCDHNCPFCYQNAGIDGKHADIEYLKVFVKDIFSYSNKTIEFSIGGGNVLLYPNLKELFKTIKDYGGIVNITITADDLKTLHENKYLADIVKDYVSGIGISVRNKKQLKYLRKIEEDHYNEYLLSKRLVIHLIPEYLGATKTSELIEEIVGISYRFNFLFLGFKNTGRGENCSVNKLSKYDLDILFKDRTYIDVDTSFANRYKNYLRSKFACEHTITYLEGEFSMYIDGVNCKAYKSSYDLSKPYDLNEMNSLLAFGKIREDNNLPNYNYFTDAKKTFESIK